MMGATHKHVMQCSVNCRLRRVREKPEEDVVSLASAGVTSSQYKLYLKI